MSRPILIAPLLVGTLAAGVWLLMTRTKFGRVMRATQQDRDLAQVFGVPVDRVFA